MSRRTARSAALASCWVIPAILAAQSVAPAPPPAASRPTAVERAWSADPDSPYARAQAVAAEHALGSTGLATGAADADVFHSATLSAFRSEPSVWRQQPVLVGWDWYSGRYPTLLAAPRSPTGAGLWLMFSAPWSGPRTGASRGVGADGPARGRHAGRPPRARGAGRR